MAVQPACGIPGCFCEDLADGVELLGRPGHVVAPGSSRSGVRSTLTLPDWEWPTGLSSGKNVI